MPAISIKGSPSQTKPEFVRTDLAGTETVDTHVASGEIALVINDDVRLDSGQIDRIARELADAFREALYATS